MTTHRRIELRTTLYLSILLAICLSTFITPSAFAQSNQQLREAISKELQQRGIKQAPANKAVTTTDQVVMHENVVYHQIGDRKLHMDVFVPENVKAAPAIMVIHGGGWSGGDKERFRPLTRYLAQYGFVTAAVEYRLAGEALFPAAIQDCNTAVRFLRKEASKYSLDPRRIGAIGGSAGGHLVALMATSNGNQELLGKTYSNYSSSLQSTIVLAGPLDLLTGSVAEKSREMPEKSNANRWLGKTVDQAPDLYRLASPLYRINESTPAIHFLLGEHDDPARNQPARSELAKLNQRSTLQVYRFGLHGCWNTTPWFQPIADDAARIFAADLKQTLAPRNLRHGEQLTNIINHHDHLILTGVNANNGKVEIPRYHARIGKTYLKNDPNKTPLKVTPEIETWIISTPPNTPASAEIVMELLDPAVLGSLPSVVAQQGSDDILLNAHFAETYGEKLRFEPQPHKNTIGYWVNPSDWCRWRIYIETPGVYDLTIHQGCGKGHGGSEVAIKSNAQAIEFIVEDTGHFQNFKPREIGHFNFETPGMYNIDIRPIKKANVAIMDVRLMELTLRK